MPTLRLRHSSEGDNRHRVLVEIPDSGRETESRIEFELSAQDRENIRWYLEDYLSQSYFEPARRSQSAS